MAPWKQKVAVVGVRFHRKAAIGFTDAVATATEARAEFGIRLEAEPDNVANPKAVRVLGYARPKHLPGETNFHIGYLPKRTATELHRRVAAGGEVSGKLRSIDFGTPDGESISIIVDLYAGVPMPAEPPSGIAL